MLVKYNPISINFLIEFLPENCNFWIQFSIHSNPTLIITFQLYSFCLFLPSIFNKKSISASKKGIMAFFVKNRPRILFEGFVLVFLNILKFVNKNTKNTFLLFTDFLNLTLRGTARTVRDDFLRGTCLKDIFFQCKFQKKIFNEQLNLN